jgi:hypothetical protein
MPDRRPQFELPFGDRFDRITASAAASPEEAAAIVAALERFGRETAAPGGAIANDLDPWLRAAMLEGVSRGPEGDQGDVSRSWINT